MKSGSTARLECAAWGQPQPQISWQKDGGNDFPAARERRMHVMPTDDVFFIVNVKSSDEGTYSCTATNEAGTAATNATLKVLGKRSAIFNCAVFGVYNSIVISLKKKVAMGLGL